MTCLSDVWQIETIGHLHSAFLCTSYSLAGLTYKWLDIYIPPSWEGSPTRMNVIFLSLPRVLSNITVTNSQLSDRVAVWRLLWWMISPPREIKLILKRPHFFTFNTQKTNCNHGKIVLSVDKGKWERSRELRAERAGRRSFAISNIIFELQFLIIWCAYINLPTFSQL